MHEAEAKPAEPEADRRDPTGEERDPSDSAVDLVRRILLGLIRAVEDGAELIGASIREELARFRWELERRVAGLLLLAGGVGLATAGLAMVLKELIGSWSPVLLLMGAVYGALGAWLFLSGGEPRGEGR